LGKIIYSFPVLWDVNILLFIDGIKTEPDVEGQVFTSLALQILKLPTPVCNPQQTYPTIVSTTSERSLSGFRILKTKPTLSAFEKGKGYYSNAQSPAQIRK